MIKVEEAVEIVLENTKLLKSENIGILSALDRVLAEDIYAGVDLPSFDNSAMDGYAVIASDTCNALQAEPKALEVVEDLRAGYVAKEKIKSGQAIRIMTGAPIPLGANAVIPFEFTERESLKVKIFKEVKEGENVRRRGEDIKKGELAIPGGKLIRPSEIGMLAALNIGTADVVKIPKVSILVTGDELIDIGGELKSGKIIDSNSYSLYSQVLRYGGFPIKLGIAEDTKEDIRAKLQEGLYADILLISAGVSVGDYDFVKDVLTDMGMKASFWKVAMRPGKPVTFGKINETLVFGLPGNPASSMITFEQFVAPALLKMQGKTNLNRRIIKAVIMEDITKKTGGIKHFIRGSVKQRNGKYFVKSVGSQSSGVLSSMVLANGLIILPEDIDKVSKGTKVSVQMPDWLEV